MNDLDIRLTYIIMEEYRSFHDNFFNITKFKIIENYLILVKLKKENIFQVMKIKLESICFLKYEIKLFCFTI